MRDRVFPGASSAVSQGAFSAGPPDMKTKVVVEVFPPTVMRQYAEVCAWTLARAHARLGEPAKISGYLGKSDAFDKAVADFAFAYADQIERDHETFVKAVRAGKVEVFIEGP
jgi:hypothetical protein